jgi:hypothetical protein
MTLKDAVKLLPVSCRGLAKNELSVDLVGLRAVVTNELNEYYNGENPITEKQRDGLLGFLIKTQR